MNTSNSESYQFTKENHNYLTIGLLIVAIYFAMFSSIQMNIILASYSIVQLLLNHLRKGEIFIQTKQLVKEWPFILIIIFWLLSLIFDANGGRAADVGHNSGLVNAIKDVLVQYKILIQCTNKLFFIICLLFICFALIYSFNSIHNNEAKSFLKIFWWIIE